MCPFWVGKAEALRPITQPLRTIDVLGLETLQSQSTFAKLVFWVLVP